MSEYIDLAVKRMQDSALEGAYPTCVLLSGFNDNEELNTFSLIIYLQMGFDMPIDLIRKVQMWQRLIKRLDLGFSDEKIDSELDSFFREWRIAKIS